MNSGDSSRSRKIQISNRILDPKRSSSLQRAVRPKKISDYPGVPKVYLKAAQHYATPLLLGPPVCDELVALVQHMFTEEEAELVCQLKSLRGKTARELAMVVRRPVEEVHSIMEELAYEKFVLICSGVNGKKRYSLMPIVPGVFEFVMMRTSLDTLTDWHRRFAELYAALYDTGYLAGYAQYPAGGLRYIPVGETIDAHQMAWPTNRLEEILDKYEVFAVGLCDCRLTERIVGRSCDRPLENCIVFGDLAKTFIQHDKMRRIQKRDVLEIKADAAAAGLASFIAEVNLPSISGGASCSCCGCCCNGLRTISQFNAPGLIAPPHFMPQVNRAQCIFCNRCAQVCPVGALIVDTKNRSLQHLAERCIGCGLCAVACDRKQAIQMEPVPKNIRSGGKLTNLALVSNYFRNVWSMWRKRWF